MLMPPKPILDFVPSFRSTQTPWQGLTPVAAWLVADLRPSRIVEIGSYRGDSFFAFLEAAAFDDNIRELVAVDSWMGDQHTGQYDTTVYAQFHCELARRADPRARSIKGFFDDAVTEFEDGSIDLLHIDGAHDYKSVKQDFKTWLPKMTPDGVILFHDTVVHEGDFGVWRLWGEIEKGYPGRSFNFEHSNGLGILCLGDSEAGVIRSLGHLGEIEARMVKDAMRMAGQRVTDLTSFESLFILRNGGEITPHHEFARGEARAAMETLMTLQQSQVKSDLQAVVNARLGQLFSEQSGDIFASLKPMLSEELASLRAALEARQDEKEATANIQFLALLDARLGKLFSEQSGDIFASLKPMLFEELASLRAALEARQDEKEAAAYTQIRRLLDAQLGPLAAARDLVTIKNEAQDDAIFDLANKIEENEKGIQELAMYLRQVLQHPRLN